jgi:hypothetical protein
MGRFLEYIKTNGCRAFLRRFVRHTPRYQRRSSRAKARRAPTGGLRATPAVGLES